MLMHIAVSHNVCLLYLPLSHLIFSLLTFKRKNLSPFTRQRFHHQSGSPPRLFNSRVKLLPIGLPQSPQTFCCGGCPWVPVGSRTPMPGAIHVLTSWLFLILGIESKRHLFITCLLQCIWYLWLIVMLLF